MKIIRLSNLFTLLNLSCGFLAIISSFEGWYDLTAIFVLIGVFSDWFDGRIARLLGQSDEFGLQLDSLADLVSYGVSPAVFVYSSVFGKNPLFPDLTPELEPYKWLLVMFLLIFPVTAAIRLSLFNVRGYTSTYSGMPSTSAAGTLFIVSLFRFTPSLTDLIFPKPTFQVGFYFMAGLYFVLAVLMVGGMTMPKWNNKFLSSVGVSKKWLAVLINALIVFALIVATRYTLFFIAILYFSGGILSFIERWVFKKL